MYLEDTVICKICGQPTKMTATKLCDGCWEVEHRLRDFLSNLKARELVKSIILEYEAIDFMNKIRKG